MENISIRRAVREDCPRIIELVRELAVYERAPDQVTVGLEEFVESGFGPSPVWWAFVAESGGHICGFALWYVRFSTWKGRRMYLEDIYVEPAMRGKGVGKMLFDRLIEQAHNQRLGGIVWQVLEWNSPAIAFYRKYGTAFDGQWINCSLEIKKFGDRC